MQNFRASGLSTTLHKLTILAVALFACLPFAQAQDSPGRFELGGSLAAVRNFRLPSDLGVGLEADFNFGRHLALDSAVDFLPSTGIEGTTVIGLFGAKVGTRSERFGYFAKVRPGFVTTEAVFRNALAIDSPSFESFNRFARLTERALDFGGVLEYYPARHWALRWDVGDMLIFRDSGPTFTLVSAGQTSSTTFPGEVTNNFRFSTGVHYRF